MKKPIPAIRKGQVWERSNGTQFTIDRVDSTYAHYWLQNSSHPQFRSIAIANFNRYRLAKKAKASKWDWNKSYWEVFKRA